jgi:hypothetical protein
VRIPLAAASAALLSLAASPSSPRAAGEAAPVEVKSTGTPGEATAVRRQKVTATVKSVDVHGRTITLEWKGGQTGAFKVGPEVTRFDEVFAGDAVQVEVEQQLRLELQPPGSPTVPFTVAGGGAPSDGSTPGGIVTGTGIQATVTITAVDLKGRIVTFKDPAGATYDVKAGPGLRIEKLKVGDRLLATYVEAMAVRLEKAAAKKP